MVVVATVAVALERAGVDSAREVVREVVALIVQVLRELDSIGLDPVAGFGVVIRSTVGGSDRA